MVTIQDILDAAQVGETTDWEFKSAKGGLPGSLWETYSAMANTEGGVLVLGVREAGGQILLDGLTPEQIARYRKGLWDNLNDRGKVNQNLLQDGGISLLPVPGGELLVMVVPRATRTQRPVFLGPNPFGHTYKRHHEGDYCCTDAEVRRMLADADELPVDHRILTNFGLEDLDPPSLTQYRQRFRAAKGDHPWLGLDDRALLEKLQGWRRDRATGEEGLTLAGIIMFGRDQSIRDPHAVPEYFVDYREKLDPEVRWTDRIYPDGRWEANLFQFFQRVWPRLASGLSTPFQLTQGVRQDESPAHEALREAFVNALVHADYFVPGGVVIERNPDRFCIDNPGTLLVSLEQYHRGSVSECRNKALQQMFLMMGGGERAGSGVDRIWSGWRSRHWRAPKVTLHTQPDRVSLELTMVSLIPEEALTFISESLGIDPATLGPLEVQALATAHLEGSVTNTRLQELANEHPVEITRCLQGLCQRGWLASDNRRRWSQYRIPTESFPGATHMGSEGQGAPIGGSFPGGDSSHSGGDSLHNVGESSHKDADSLHTGQGPSGDLGIPLGWSPEEDGQLRSIAKPIAHSDRATPSEVRRVIRSLCHNRFLNVEQFADLLARNGSGLRNRYLTPMAKDGALRLRYPLTPNRPDQAYTATPLDNCP
jgi:ATP-dependent DNA helicase RecG